MIKKQGGFTALEMLIVILLVSLIVGLSFRTYQTWQKNIQLNNARDEIKSTLFRAQQLATAASLNNPWGMHLETTTYTLFKGTFYNQNDPDNKTWELDGIEIAEPALSFSDGAGGRSADVVFGKFNGQTANTGTIRIYPEVDPDLNKTIEIKASGHID